MKNALLVSVWLLFFMVNAHAGFDTELHVNYSYSESDLCSSVSARLFFRSKHELGDRNGRLNERNGGYSGDCYFGKGKNFYAIVGGLQNSQWGQTLVFGPGVRLRSPQFLGLSLGGGVELPFIYYEMPYNRKKSYSYGFLPIPFKTITLELSLDVCIPIERFPLQFIDERVEYLGRHHAEVDIPPHHHHGNPRGMNRHIHHADYSFDAPCVYSNSTVCED